MTVAMMDMVIGFLAGALGGCIVVVARTIKVIYDLWKEGGKR